MFLFIYFIFYSYGFRSATEIIQLVVVYLITWIKLCNLNRSITTWQRAYTVTLKTRKAKQLRLDELLTWDKSNGNIWEHTAKVTALQNLLNDGKKLKQ